MPYTLLSTLVKSSEIFTKGSNICLQDLTFGFVKLTSLYQCDFVYLQFFSISCRSEIVHAMMNLLLRYWDLIKHMLVLLLLHLFVKPLKSQLSFCYDDLIHSTTHKYMPELEVLHSLPQNKFQFNQSLKWLRELSCLFHPTLYALSK